MEKRKRLSSTICLFILLSIAFLKENRQTKGPSGSLRAFAIHNSKAYERHRKLMREVMKQEGLEGESVEGKEARTLQFFLRQVGMTVSRKKVALLV